MFKDILRQLGVLVLRLLRWYFDIVKKSWVREVRNFRGRENKWVWIALCIVFSILLFPYLTGEAFHDSFWLGLSFLWSGILAISFAYILKNPLVMIIIYVGVVVGREVMKIFSVAKDEASQGNILGALIVFALGVYLLIWANHMKKGDYD